ncbi:MAG TPA: N-acetylmuramoyl-L-alanine amidase, partial [Vineibacter sp.]|nr:N-acetylmuramoyl-L-alanine amidase [Vineibacter sp.]
MAWDTAKAHMHPHHHDVVIGPPYDFGDLDIVAKSGLLTGSGVLFKQCAHYGGKLYNPSVIMVHFTTSIGTARQVIADMDSQHVSSHVVVDRSGELWQAVPFNRVAMHAGAGGWSGYRNNINEHAIGIEVNNLGPLWLSENNRFIDSYGIDRDFRGFEHRDRRVDIIP